jgi:uncharacterized protein (DUF1330 family)
MEKYLDGSKEQFMEFMQLPTDKPLQMLNLLKFKKQVEGTVLTGEQQYNAYMKAALPFIKNSNAKVLYYGKANYALIGPKGELEWDKVIIVEYATKEDFANMVMQKDYPSEMRTAALENSRLIFCSAV